MQELTNLRTLHAKHFDLGDGKRQAVIQQGQHYFDRDTGKYENYRAAVDDDPYPTGFGKRFKGQHWSRFGNDGQWRIGLGQGVSLTYAPQDAGTVSPVVDGGLVNYPELWADVDLGLAVYPEGIKETLTLRSSTRSAFSFTLSRQNVTLRASGNTFEALDDTGDVVGRIAAPTVVDAAGVAGTVALTIEDDVLTLAVDEAWLADAARVFPVTVDPTTVTVQPSALDTWIGAGNPTTAHGSDYAMRVGTDNGGSAYWGLVQFSLSTVPAGSSLTEVLLGLYAEAGVNSGIFRSGFLVTSAWTEATTWNTKPTVGAELFAADARDVNTGWKQHDITATGKGWFAGTIANYGLELRDKTPNTGAYVDFSSRENLTTANRPKLTITYETPAAPSITSPNGTSGAPTSITDEVTPDLVGVYNCSFAVNMTHRQHQVYDSDNNLVWDSGKQAEAAAPTDTITVTVPDGELVFGETYFWRWMAWAANGGYTPWSDSGYFVCSLSAPANLTATADPTNAEIDLAWDAHAGETVAGYNVYRAAHDSATYTKINVEGLVATNAYTDEAVGSAIEYDYKITAVSSDGYESAKTALATQHVDFTGSWINDTQVRIIKVHPKMPHRRFGNARDTVNHNVKVQDFGYGPRKALLRLRYLTRSERETIISLFATANAYYSYRDYTGDSIKGKIIGDLSPEYLALGATAGYIDVTLVEEVRTV